MEICANANLKSQAVMIWLKQIPPQAMLVWGKNYSSNGKIAMALFLRQKDRVKKSHTDKMFLFITYNKICSKTQASFWWLIPLLIKYKRVYFYNYNRWKTIKLYFRLMHSHPYYPLFACVSPLKLFYNNIKISKV